MSVEGYSYGRLIAAFIYFLPASFHLVMELTCFGGLISGFIKQAEELGHQHQIYNTEDLLEQCTHLIDRFRELKKGFEPLLFILFSTNMYILIVFSYSTIIGITGKTMFIVIVTNIIGTAVPISLLTYAALLADDGFTALKDMSSALR